MIATHLKKNTRMKIRPICLSFLIAAGFVTGSYAQPVFTLQEAIAQGLQTNLGLQVADNDRRIADVLNNWGNAGRLPTVNANLGYNFSLNNLEQKLANGTEIKRDGATFQTENANVQAQWRLYNGGRVVAAKRRLNEQELIANTAYRQQANQVVYEIITAYLNVLRFNSQLTAQQETMLLFEERMKLAENRFNIGTANKSDYLQALTDYNEVKNNIIGIENNIAASKVFLNTLLARDPMIDFNTSDSIAEVSFGDYSSMLAAVDTLNPGLLIAQSQLKVLSQLNREINSQRLPSVTLNAGANLNNSNNSSGFTLRNTTYGPNAGVGVAIPIFQGGVIKQNLKVNQIQQESQAIEIKRLRNALSAGIATAYNNYRNAKRQYELELENIKVVKENNVIAMERFRKGSITTVELRQTQINLIVSQTRLINARYEMKQAEADVLVLMGKLVE